MTSASSQPAKRQPWERRSWPEIGDADKDDTYKAVGKALSAWEVFEAQLAHLFTQFIYPGRDSLASRRAYGAVRTFEGRLDMLTAASKVYFKYFYNEQLAKEFANLAGKAKNYAGRRNDIAHGIVGKWQFLPLAGLPEVWWNPEEGEMELYCLYPSYIMTKARDLSETPEYAMTSKEILYFESEFYTLRDLAFPVITSVLDSKPPS